MVAPLCVNVAELRDTGKVTSFRCVYEGVSRGNEHLNL